MKKSKDNHNLVRTDTFMYKIKAFFFNLFNRKNSALETVQENQVHMDTPMQEQNTIRNSFMGQLKSEEEHSAKSLIALLKNNKITVEELTKEQKEEVVVLLQEEVSAKRDRLKNLKNKILYKKLKNSDDIDSILDRVSEENKTNFVAFLQEQIGDKKKRLNELNSKIAKKVNT